MRIARQCLIAAALGVITTVLIAWAFAAWQTIPMYLGQPATLLPRPYAAAFVWKERPWSTNEIRGWGYMDRWWMDLHADSPGIEARKIVTDDLAHWQTLKHQSPRHQQVIVTNVPPPWGTFREPEPPPPEFVIGSDTAFGWPLPCMWYQVQGKLAGDLKTGFSTADPHLRGGLFLRGEVDARGRDFHALPLRPIWTPLLLDALIFSAVWWLILLAPGGLRRALRRHRGACPTCGYDLRGEPAAGCPECGWNRPAA